MSNKINQPPEEEVDLGNLFKVIGRGIKNIFISIAHFFSRVLHYFILLLIFIKDHALKLGLALLIGAIIGGVLDYIGHKTYVSNSIIETNYGSGIQLYKQVNYLNDLVLKNDTLSLSKALKMPNEEVSQFSKFGIAAFQPKKNIYKSYDKYLQSIDTAVIKGVTLDEFRNRIDEYEYQFHEITVSSRLNSSFKKITPALMLLVENQYYVDVRDKKRDELKQKRSVLEKNLVQIDSLRSFYKKVALIEAQKQTGNSTVEISQNDIDNNKNDIELFYTSNNILKEIESINEDLLEKENILNVVSDFDRVGVAEKGVFSKKYFQLALLFVGLMLAWILIKQLNSYLNSYKIQKNKSV